MIAEDSLPDPFRRALEVLRASRVDSTRVDATDGNFAYVWASTIIKNTTDESSGGWIRLPLAFPYANPHGLVTTEALKRTDGGNVTDGYNPGHEMCGPVRSLGGAHYYSWTWEGAPQLREPEEIIGVVQWYERRIRRG